MNREEKDPMDELSEPVSETEARELEEQDRAQSVIIINDIMRYIVDFLDEVDWKRKLALIADVEDAATQIRELVEARLGLDDVPDQSDACWEEQHEKCKEPDSCACRCHGRKEIT